MNTGTSFSRAADQAGDAFDEARMAHGRRIRHRRALAEAHEINVRGVGVVEAGQGVEESGDGGHGLVEHVKGRPLVRFAGMPGIAPVRVGLDRAGRGQQPASGKRPGEDPHHGFVAAAPVKHDASAERVRAGGSRFAHLVDEAGGVEDRAGGDEVR